MTNQDAGMRKAIKDELQLLVHINYFRHLIKNAIDALSALFAQNKGLYDQIYDLVTQSLIVEEFENVWTAMLAKYEISEHKYLNQMYKTREMWIPVYFKKVWCPFIKSTGRSESTNSGFKDYVMRKDTIETFLKQYEIYQDEQRENENEDRFESNLVVPIYSSMQPIERHAGEIYTRRMYLKFQLQLFNASAYSVNELIKDERYMVEKIIEYKDPGYKRKFFTFEVDRSMNKFDCICVEILTEMEYYVATYFDCSHSLEYTLYQMNTSRKDGQRSSRKQNFKKERKYLCKKKGDR